MRCWSLFCGACAGLLLASWVVRAQQDEPQYTVEDIRYGQDLARALHDIADKYVLPVRPGKLGAVALRGLYERAGVPLPAELRNDLPDDRGQLERALARGRHVLGNRSPVRFDMAVRASLEAVLQSLDPHCVYLTLEEYQRHMGLQAPVGSPGLVFEERSAPGGLYVWQVIADGPAHRAGILPGDLLLKVDGQPLRNEPASWIKQRLDGILGSPVTLTFKRFASDQEYTVKLVRSTVQEDTVQGWSRAPDGTWNYWVAPVERIAYVRLGTIAGDGTGGDTVAALRSVVFHIQEQGVRGLILDLRDCPGGGLEAALQVAASFTSERILIRVRGRHGDDLPRVLPGSGKDSFAMAVLVSPETSGGGELIAACLQDYNRSVVIGQRTRGKGTVQSILALQGSGRHAARLTTGLLVRPSGKNLHRFPESRPQDDWGVLPAPGYDIRMSPDLRRKLRRWRLEAESAARADTPKAVIPLEPRDDPVLVEALAYFRKLLPARTQKKAALLHPLRAQP